MQFGDAVTAMRNGLKVYRPAWDRSTYIEPGSYLTIGRREDPQAQGGESECIELVAGAGSTVASPWLGVKGGNGASDESLLADDWEIRQ